MHDEQKDLARDVEQIYSEQEVPLPSLKWLNVLESDYIDDAYAEALDVLADIPEHPHQMP